MSSKIAFLILLLAAMPLNAQVLRGRVFETGSHQPIPGAFVTLIDSIGIRRAGTLTDSAGTYIFRQTPAGRWRVRAEVIGHRSYVSEEFDSLITPVLDIAMPVQAIALAGIEAKAGHRCAVMPKAGQQTMQLWEEARKALSVTSWVQTDQPVVILASTYRRLLHPRTLDVLNEQSEESVNNGRAYAAVDPAKLAARGYMQTLPGDSLAYFGPDADVLLSDVFLETHCFAVTRAHGDIGLSFKPVPGRKMPEISGTLWLTPGGALESIDFIYVGLPYPFNRFKATGRTEFRRLPTGMWIVDKWFIRSPIVALSAGEYLLLNYGESGGRVVDVRKRN